MRSLLGALVLLIAALPARAQQPANAFPVPFAPIGPAGQAETQATPDTTSPWRYVPLHVGNVWEYQYGAAFFRTFIEKDTLINGHRYAKEGTQDIRSNGTTTRPYDYRYIRFDTTSATCSNGTPSPTDCLDVTSVAPPARSIRPSTARCSADRPTTLSRVR